MGFYIKKGLNFGLLRINFSKSGVGLSFGIKGFRIGVGPKGNYVHAGRKGLYYRKSLPNINESQITINWFIVVVLILVLGLVYIKFGDELIEKFRSVLM